MDCKVCGGKGWYEIHTGETTITGAPVMKKVACARCGGSGNATGNAPVEMIKCPRCGGSGKVYGVKECGSCNGTGEIAKP